MHARMYASLAALLATAAGCSGAAAHEDAPASEPRAIPSSSQAFPAEWVRPADCLPAETTLRQPPAAGSFVSAKPEVTWTSAAPLPDGPPSLVLFSLHDGRALAMGDGPPRTYDVALDRWSETALLPIDSFDAKVAIVRDDELVVAGGSREGLRIARYRVSANTWTLDAALTDFAGCNRSLVVAMGLRGFLALGGYHDDGTSCAPGRSWFYDVASASWMAKAPMGYRGDELEAGVGSGDLALVVSSNYEGRRTEGLSLFDLARNEWMLIPLPFGHRWSGAPKFTLPNGDFMIGDQPTRQSSEDTPMPFARFDARCRVFRPAAWLPVTQYGAAPITLDDGRVLLAGGYSAPSGYNLLPPLFNGVYDPMADQWTAIGVAPVRASNAAARVRPGILMAGICARAYCSAASPVTTNVVRWP